LYYCLTMTTTSGLSVFILRLGCFCARRCLQCLPTWRDLIMFANNQLREDWGFQPMGFRCRYMIRHIYRVITTLLKPHFSLWLCIYSNSDFWNFELSCIYYLKTTLLFSNNIENINIKYCSLAIWYIFTIPNRLSLQGNVYISTLLKKWYILSFTKLSRHTKKTLRQTFTNIWHSVIPQLDKYIVKS